MNSEEALRKHRQQVADQSTQIREVALLLRENIMNAEKTPLQVSSGTVQCTNTLYIPNTWTRL